MPTHVDLDKNIILSLPLPLSLYLPFYVCLSLTKYLHDEAMKITCSCQKHLKCFSSSCLTRLLYVNSMYVYANFHHHWQIIETTIEGGKWREKDWENIEENSSFGLYTVIDRDIAECGRQSGKFFKTYWRNYHTWLIFHNCHWLLLAYARNLSRIRVLLISLANLHCKPKIMLQ